MSIWSIPVPVTGESESVRADKQSKFPLSVPAVEGSVRTRMGSDVNYTKPQGTYSFINPDLVARNRRRQAEQFCLLLEAEAAFEATFSEVPPPHSFIRSTNHQSKAGGIK